ncbi:MAG TPA: hypothetical protein VJ983_05620 [candidate division Zixibacteria bacterium]|nr:hypothetical protein [candidate division Zixibacteria bacterium]
MSTTSYIPNGRTSLIKRGNASLQVQTEYAYRPYPRLTTTISNNGQVVHKIEKKLDRPIESFEEQTRVETIMKQQHGEILAIIREDSSITRAQPLEPEASEPQAPPIEITFRDRLKEIPGVGQVFHLNVDGSFATRASAETFRQEHKVIFENLNELLGVFPMNSGATSNRDRGVLEIERDSLYLISCGDEMFFLTVGPTDADIVYEKAIKEVLDDFYREW